MPRPLTSARLRLRPSSPADVDLMLALDDDPEVMRYLSDQPTRRTDVEAAVEHDEDGWGRWTAEDAGGFVGWFALVARPGTEGLELGYRLARAAWGKGYATEGAAALVELAREHGVGRLHAETMAVNARSLAVLEKLGFTRVRTYNGTWDHPLPGSEHGEAVYELRL